MWGVLRLATQTRRFRVTQRIDERGVDKGTKRRSARLGMALVVTTLGAGQACTGGTAVPASRAASEQLGAPRDTHFTADVEAQRGFVRVIVREQSLCDVIPVESYVSNGKKRQVAGDPLRAQPCAERPARNVVVSLEVEGNTYRLGEPNHRGEVDVQLNDALLRSLYGDDPQTLPIAKVMLRHPNGESQQVGAVELTQLAASDRQLERLLREFESVIDRPQTRLSGADLARAYELYEQLARWSGSDPRISALQALFLERLYDRKALEANQRFENNLEALNAAKEILSHSQRTLVLPSAVTSALDAGSMTPEAADWARGQVAIALRRYPALCGPGANPGFTWSRVNLSPPPPTSRLAFEMLRFAYDNPYEAEISNLCRRVLG